MKQITGIGTSQRLSQAEAKQKSKYQNWGKKSEYDGIKAAISQ